MSRFIPGSIVKLTERKCPECENVSDEFEVDTTLTMLDPKVDKAGAVRCTADVSIVISCRECGEELWTAEIAPTVDLDDVHT